MGDVQTLSDNIDFIFGDMSTVSDTAFANCAAALRDVRGLRLLPPARVAQRHEKRAQLG